MRKLALSVLASVAMFTVSAPATAAITTSCTVIGLDDTNPAASACTGYYDGNVFNSSPANAPILTAAVASLGGTYSGTFTDYATQSPLLGATTINFATALFGPTILGIHYGGGANVPNTKDISAFYLINFAAPTSSIKLTLAASSNITVFKTGSAVPEPGTWAMMLVGFGAAGYSLRRRRKVTLQAA